MVRMVRAHLATIAAFLSVGLVCCTMGRTVVEGTGRKIASNSEVTEDQTAIDHWAVGSRGQTTAKVVKMRVAVAQEDVVAPSQSVQYLSPATG